MLPHRIATLPLLHDWLQHKHLCPRHRWCHRRCHQLHPTPRCLVLLLLQQRQKVAAAAPAATYRCQPYETPIRSAPGVAWRPSGALLLLILLVLLVRVLLLLLHLRLELLLLLLLRGCKVCAAADCWDVDVGLTTHTPAKWTTGQRHQGCLDIICVPVMPRLGLLT